MTYETYIREIDPAEEIKYVLPASKGSDANDILKDLDLDTLFERLKEVTSDDNDFDLQEIKHLRWTITELANQISTREQMRDDNLERINEIIIKHSEELSKIDIIFQYPDFDAQAGKLKTNAVKMIDALEKEMRFESTAAFRDISRIKSDLMEAVVKLHSLIAERGGF